MVSPKESVKDIDGNTYKTVQIGEQVWMAENLKVTHYHNGDAIPTGHSDSDWSNLSTGAYAVYKDDLSNADIYGNLYNWYALDDDRGVCPEGFHVPSDEEFMELEMELGMSEEEANSMGYRGINEGSKLAGNSDLWNDGDLVNNPEFGTSGFSAFPAGYRGRYDGSYSSMGRAGAFWSSSVHSSGGARGRIPSSRSSSVTRLHRPKQNGFSIRCLGD